MTQLTCEACSNLFDPSLDFCPQCGLTHNEWGAQTWRLVDQIATKVERDNPPDSSPPGVREPEQETDDE